jgi:chromosome segregation ATPase
MINENEEIREENKELEEEKSKFEEVKKALQIEIHKLEDGLKSKDATETKLQTASDRIKELEAKINEKETEIHDERTSAASGNEEYTNCIEDLKKANEKKSKLETEI